MLRVALAPIAVPNLVAATADSLREHILAGRFSGGTLPSQARLCESLAVSRPVLREAVSKLQAEGLLEVSQGTVARIVPPSPAPAVDALRRYMSRSSPALKNLQQVRRPLEIEIAGLAARAASPEHCGRMRQAIADQRAAKRLDDQIAADERFHNELAEATGNPLFRTVQEVLAKLLHDSRRKTIPRSGTEMALAFHARILAAVEAGQVDQARAAMAEHMDQTERDLAGQ